MHRSTNILLMHQRSSMHQCIIRSLDMCISKHRDGLSSLNRRSTSSGQKRRWHAQRSRHVESALGESSWFLSSTLAHCICNHHVLFANNALKHPQHLCRSTPVIIGEDRLLHVPYEVPMGVPLSLVLSNRRFDLAHPCVGISPLSSIGSSYIHP